MRVLYLSDVAHFKGGAEKSLFDAMTTPGVEAILCAPEDGPLTQAAQESGIESCTLDYGRVLGVHRPLRIFGIASALIDAVKAAWRLRRHRVDAIHSNGLKAHGVACLARVFGGPKVIVHIRSIPHTRLEKLFWVFMRVMAARMVLVSRPCWPDGLLGRTLPPNARVVFNGIVALDDGFLSDARPQSPFILGFAGRIHPSKGVHDAIAWLSDCRDLPLRFVIRGEADPQDSAYAQALNQQVTDLGLEDMCVFEGQKTGYQAIYEGIDAVIVPSTTPDPLPRACMEGAALGLPVLGYPAGGIPDMIEDGESGFLVANAQDLRRAIEALSDAERYAVMSKAATSHARTHFSLDALHRALKGIYAQVVNAAQ